MKKWDELDLAWNQLGILPKRWQAKLAEWRGIYYIFDASDGKGYVGSAYGADNLLGRWRNYAASGHGGNRLLRERDPQGFRFTILERSRRPWTPTRSSSGKYLEGQAAHAHSRAGSTTTRAGFGWVDWDFPAGLDSRPGGIDLDSGGRIDAEAMLLRVARASCGRGY